MKVAQTQVSNKVIVMYLIIFFSWWSLFELSGVPLLGSPLTQKLSGSIIKFLTWTVPAIFLMKRYSNSLYLPFNTILKNKFNLRPYLLIIVLMISYVFIGSWIKNGQLQFNELFNPYDLIDTFFFVGITEEIVFRGWLLNELLVKTRKIKAVFSTPFSFY
nr:CPBP family glutamic-type intramembrane protease [Enterococcus sp. HY326]